MPKSKKAKREKQADFQRTKLKLGKGKQPAANATNTAFTSKAVGLPNQNIGGADDKAGQPTTKRGQTLDVLLVQLGHYSAHVRRDALTGLRELLSTHAELISMHLGIILKPLAKLIADDDATVRKGIIAFLEWLLPSVAYDYLAPFLPLMLFSTTSALTHIFPEVRLDGLKVLDVLLGVCPQAVTEGWSASTSTGSATHGQRVLEAYLSILHIRGGQGTTVSSPTARLVALESFGRFLRAALFPAAELRPDDLVDVQLPTWFFAPSFASTHDFDAFIAAMEPTSRAPVRAWDAPAEPIERFDLASPDRHGPGPSDLQTAVDDLLRANETTTSTQGTQNALTLLTLLHPTLTSTFLEAAPTAFAPSAGSTSGPHLAIALCAARIARDLWRACTTDHLAPSKADHKALRTLVEKMAVYFPFAGDDNLLYARNNESQASLQELDLIYCELVSLLVITAASARTLDPKLDAGFSLVGKHVAALLSKAGGVPLSASDYAALTPTLWTLLGHQDGSSAVAGSLVEHFASTNSGSGLKRVSLIFLSHVIEASLSPAFRGSLRLAPATISAFHDALPRLLWDLAIRDINLSTRALACLHRAAVRCTLSTTTLERLAPFFSLRHPQRGLVRGPYGRLPERARGLARAVVVLSEDEGLAAALGARRDAQDRFKGSRCGP